MAPLLKGSLRMSKYGQVQVDVRTNTLIIADLPDQFPAIRQLLTTLDRAEPQVEVEARIVQTTRDFAKAIGVQWGLNGRMMPDIGNTTDLAFPNRARSAAASARRPGSNRERSDARAAAPSSTCRPDATTAIGLALGAVNGAFNLDVALSALERSGKGRVLSTPRRDDAEQHRGRGHAGRADSHSTPVSQRNRHGDLQGRGADAQGDAADHRGQHRHHADRVENATGGLQPRSTAFRPINTQRANTHVQINDGATTVIGGIFVAHRDDELSDRTPLLLSHAAARLALQERPQRGREPRAADLHHTTHSEGLRSMNRGSIVDARVSRKAVWGGEVGRLARLIARHRADAAQRLVRRCSRARARARPT